jgi:hypothetical protein
VAGGKEMALFGVCQRHKAATIEVSIEVRSVASPLWQLKAHGLPCVRFVDYPRATTQTGGPPSARLGDKRTFGYRSVSGDQLMENACSVTGRFPFDTRVKSPQAPAASKSAPVMIR